MDIPASKLANKWGRKILIWGMGRMKSGQNKMNRFAAPRHGYAGMKNKVFM
ncbi:hypothetical protein ACO0LM_23065 [Undibacterium sp. Di26W]|uniref:hypothetical protein n=1 Tax=Undibacterium sp. Di26W TaxID=3413035 RepID=UPI003BF163C3